MKSPKDFFDPVQNLLLRYLYNGKSLFGRALRAGLSAAIFLYRGGYKKDFRFYPSRKREMTDEGWRMTVVSR